MNHSTFLSTVSILNVILGFCKKKKKKPSCGFITEFIDMLMLEAFIKTPKISLQHEQYRQQGKTLTENLQ